jgi:hypothetical protein
MWFTLHLQESYVRNYGELLRHHGEPPVAVKRVETVEEVLKEADVSHTDTYFTPAGGGDEEGRAAGDWG